MEELVRRDEFRIVLISSYDARFNKKAIFKSIKKLFSFYTVQIYHLATAKFIFLNDNFMPLGLLKFKKEAIITQLWHAEGIFKKFGFDVEQPQEIRELEKKSSEVLDYVICSSEDVVPYYADAFGVDESIVLPLGAARTDRLLNNKNTERLRMSFDRKYPECKGKKLVLYAPTFRDNPEDDGNLIEKFDIKAFNERFGEKYKLLIRLHPQVHTSYTSFDGAVDVCDYQNVSELVEVCDVLITDYSSICMDFALLDKPIYFYAFDLEKYNNQRSFYVDYETYVPGPVAKDFQTLLNLINSEIHKTYFPRNENFKKFNFGKPDGQAAKRIVETIVYNKKYEV
ncbi:MAG: CDP-glycerol glycerophosphotransferase family protein, partial [Ruminococcus sp.]|nr:CDP-glycerol glycerophosphotransferase family protein [Candidatus Copronaster equi]